MKVLNSKHATPIATEIIGFKLWSQKGGGSDRATYSGVAGLNPTALCSRENCHADFINPCSCHTVSCNGSRYSGSLAIPDALRMWGATRFRVGKSRFIIPDGSYNAARSDRTQLLSDIFPCLPYICTSLYRTASLA